MYLILLCIFALADARPEMDHGANLPSDLDPPMTTKEVSCDSTEKDCSDDWGVPRSKKQDDLIIFGDGIAQRMERKDDDITRKLGVIKMRHTHHKLGYSPIFWNSEEQRFTIQ